MTSATERALTQEFGLTTATSVQRAACRVRDGVPLAELKNHPQVIQAFGGAEAVAALPSERGFKPTHFYNISSARCAKTTMAVASALVDALNLDLSGMAPGEIPRITILSLKLDVADVPFRRLQGAIESSPALSRLVESSNATSLTLRNRQGKPVEVAVVAGGKAAGGLAARWSAGLIADEAPRMSGRDEGVTNLDDALSVIRERLLPGAQIQCVGSPWAPSGPVYEAVQQHFGKPSEHFVVMRTIGPHGNPSYWTAERLERLKETDEIAYRINALGEFCDPESGLLNPVAVRRATRDTPLELPPDPAGNYGAAVDPAEGSANGNAWTLCLVQRVTATNEQGDEIAGYKVALTKEYRGLGPDACWREIAAELKRYGVTRAVSDQYAASANVDLASRHGLTVEIARATAQSKLEDFTNLATLIHNGTLELSPDRQLRADLLSVKKRATQAGVSIHLPRTSDGRHCDFAPALAAAVKAVTAKRFRMVEWLEREHASGAWEDDPSHPAVIARREADRVARARADAEADRALQEKAWIAQGIPLPKILEWRNDRLDEARNLGENQ